VITTSYGPVRGVIHDGVREFRGIPYAAPPVGVPRWALPQPPAPWTSIRDASQYGNACPQVSRYGLTEESDTENCLTLNVTTPWNGAAPAKKLPVMVWIHGGAFVGGSSALYPLAHLAQAGGIVVVSLNYRLGVFGFMAHPAFGKAHDGGYGLEDQRFALHWVKQNIAAFGGDPNNVTIAGESAGAAGVCMHIIAPAETQGLFEKAIIQSGGCASPLHSIAQGNQFGEKVAALAGCADSKTALACLRGQPVETLLQAAAKAGGGDLMSYAPLVGAATVPVQWNTAFATGRYVRVSVMNGGTRNELRLYVAYDIQGGEKIASYPEALKAVYGDNMDTVLKEYPLSAYSSAPAALGSVMSDFNPKVGLNNCIYLDAAKMMTKRELVYELEFADPNAPAVTADPGFEMGAVHSSELPYLFPHFDNTSKVAGPDLSPASHKISDELVAYVTSFVKTGHPIAPEGPTWPRYTADSDVMLFYPGKTGLYDATSQHKCGFWKLLYPKILTE
jgi:para-nitrobenzyl esterase